MRSFLKPFLAIWTVSLLAFGCGNDAPGPGLLDTLVDLPDVPVDTDLDVPTDLPTEGDPIEETCEDGLTPCGGECVDTSIDTENCGTCGNLCDPGEVCSDGVCALECVDPLVECDGSCVDTVTDPDNCGECGNICPDGTPLDVNMVPGCEDSTCILECDTGWADLDGDPGCEYPCTFVSDDEICNGSDDNCNGEADEGFECVFGEGVLCTTECGSTGSGVCSMSCEPPSGSSCIPPTETCNGLDDDCDGDFDEGYDCIAGTTVACTTACGGVGSGTCSDLCALPEGADCSEGPEICNGLDDNCNGSVDESFDCEMSAPTACTTTCGSTGTGTCSASCEFPLAADCAPPAEICNGLDDDCNGTADDGFDCVMGASVSCTTDCSTPGTGLCTSSCTIPTGTGCAAGTEICNGTDDDCNGLADDTFDCIRFAAVSCTTTCGSAGTGSCSASCELPLAADCTPPLESCNGLDDDCDTLPDETYGCVQGEPVTCTTFCGTVGTGTCSASCSMPSSAACTAPTEICNGLDEDCVGGSDNGFDCVMGQVTSCTTTCGSTGVGVCSSSCELPAPASCSPPSETCNGLDDDCNGTPDDGAGMQCEQGASVACTTSCGSTGTGFCTAGCLLPPTWLCTGPAETCNGLDDDCSGTADDGAGMQCVQGAPASCTTTCATTGTGTCSATCTLPGPSSCTPPTETCNGLDDDCSGTADDGAGMQCIQGATGVACTTGAGLAGTADCTSICILGTCCASTEVCNGIDDTCSGTADDGAGMDCIQSTTGYSCTTGGGAAGSRDCSGSCTFTTCCASSETCGNGWDDDCDGMDDATDPDCACTVPDDCTCPTPITGSGTYTDDTTLMNADFEGGCGSTGGQDAIFEMVISERSDVVLDTEGTSFSDTVLYIQTGSCGGTVLECDDDDGSTSYHSMISRTLDPGTYWVVVDGYNSSYSGPFQLNVSINPVGEGDDCSNPISYGWPGTASGTTVGYTDDYGSWSCQSSSGGADIVYELVVPSGGRDVTIHTGGSSFDTVLVVTNTSCSELYCDDDGYGYPESEISTFLAAGTYYIVVDGYGGASGSFSLNVSWI